MKKLMLILIMTMILGVMSGQEQKNKKKYNVVGTSLFQNLGYEEDKEGGFLEAQVYYYRIHKKSRLEVDLGYSLTRSEPVFKVIFLYDHYIVRTSMGLDFYIGMGIGAYGNSGYMDVEQANKYNVYKNERVSFLSGAFLFNTGVEYTFNNLPLVIKGELRYEKATARINYSGKRSKRGQVHGNNTSIGVSLGYRF